MEEATLSPSASRMWNQLENGGFENIPRKKAKFFNFIQNSMRTGDKKAIEEIWCVFETSFNQQRQGQQQVKCFIFFELKTDKIQYSRQNS